MKFKVKITPPPGTDSKRPVNYYGWDVVPLNAGQAWDGYFFSGVSPTEEEARVKATAAARNFKAWIENHDLRDAIPLVYEVEV